MYNQPRGQGDLMRMFGPPCDSAELVTREVPILGEVLLHPLIVPQLYRIMRAIENDGLAQHIDMGQFGGSYNCRRMRGGTLWSHHSFGIAVDLNVHEAPDGSRMDNINFGMRGEFPHLRRLVPYFLVEDWACGIQWQRVPDPMHFEARSEHGTGILQQGTLKGISLDDIPGITDVDLAYLEGYPEFQALRDKYVWALPNGVRVPFWMEDGRGTVRIADIVEAMGWNLDVQGWPVMRSDIG